MLAWAMEDVRDGDSGAKRKELLKHRGRKVGLLVYVGRDDDDDGIVVLPGLPVIRLVLDFGLWMMERRFCCGDWVLLLFGLSIALPLWEW